MPIIQLKEYISRCFGKGRAVPFGTSYRYEYSIKDHLGNSRVMFCDLENDPEVSGLNKEDPDTSGFRERSIIHLGCGRKGMVDKSR